MVKIKYWNKRKHCYEVTEFTDDDWSDIVYNCHLSGIPLNAEIIY